MAENINDLTKKQKELYDYLLSFPKEGETDNGGWVITSYQKIVKQISISKPTVCSALTVLEQNGYIKTESTSKGTKYKILKFVEKDGHENTPESDNVTNLNVEDDDVEIYKSKQINKEDNVNDDKVTELEGIITELKYELNKQTRYLQDCINELKSEYKRHIETMHDEYETNEVELPSLPKIIYDYEYFGERPEWMDETDRVFTSIWQKFTEDKKRYGYIIDFDDTIRPLLGLIPKVHHSDAAKGIQKAIETIIKEWAGTISGDATRTAYMKLMRQYGFEYDNSYHAEALDNLQYEKSRNNRNN